ncbi:MAG: hypothetical protein D6723_18990 [Acidobacteria bacterium]|nr:MAG: hypothetical protein D6723_18990 [Acidobacteriota bacterium]
MTGKKRTTIHTVCPCPGRLRSNSRRRLVGLIGLLALALLVNRPAHAQVPISGRLAGTIRNEAGVPQAGLRVQLTYKGVIEPGAPVALQVRATVTNVDGLFIIDQIEPGVYELLVHSPIYEAVRQDIEISTAKAKIVEIVLGPESRLALTREVEIDREFRAQVISTVEFQLGTRVREPVVNTREGLLGGSFEPERLTALPLSGRNYLDLLKLQPGVFDENGGEGFGAFNGTRSTAQNFTLDGTENTDADVALPSLAEDGAVPLDAVREFRVITSNANAEYGRNTGGQVSLFIKRGSNDVHGSVYEFFTQDRLNARDFFDFDPQFADRGFKPPALRHQFGANVGGPVIEDRHFFFTAYEGFRNRQRFPRNVRVPTVGEFGLKGRLVRRLALAMERGGFDERTGFPVLPAPSPLLVAIFRRAYPDPTRALVGPDGIANPDVGIFDTTVPLVNDTDSFLVRTDHQMTPHSHLHVRYAISDGQESIMGNGLPGTGAGKDFRAQNVSIVNTQIIGDDHVNEIRFGFSRNRVDFPTAETPTDIRRLENETFPDVDPSLRSNGRTFGELYPDIRFGADNSRIDGFPFFIFPNGLFDNFGVDSLKFPQGRARNTFQIGDTYSIIRGRQAIRFGIDIRRLQQNVISGFSLRPSFILPDVGGANSLFTDFILGGRQNFFFTRECGAGDVRACAASDVDGDGLPDGPVIRGLRSTEYGAFVQDNIKLTARLTLDLGLRYEIFGRESEADDFLSRAVNYRFAPFTPDQTLASTFAVKQFGPEVGFTVREADLNNLGPRVGLAWDPFGDGKTAIRAAYGIYYDHIQGTTIFPSQLNPPGVLSFVIPREVFLTPDGFRRRPIRLGQVPVAIAPGALFKVDEAGQIVRDAEGNPVAFPLPLNLVDPGMRDPYAQRWNFTIQREVDEDTFIEASYVGSKGTRLLRARAPNLGPFLVDAAALGAIYFDSGLFHRPNAAFDVITVQESSASSIYHSFQLHVQRRWRRGLTFQVAYTVGKSLDDVSSNVVPAGTGGSIFPQNSFDMSTERGRSAFDVRQRLAFNYVVELPIGPGRRFFGRSRGLLGKWLEGWSVSGVTVFQTGFPLTLLAGFDVNEDGLFNDRPILVPGRSLDDLLVPGGGKNGQTQYFRDPTGGDGQFCDFDPDDPSACNDIVTPGRSTPFLDPSPFNLPPLYGRFDFDTFQMMLRGNLLRPFDPGLQLGRGVLTGPGRARFDFAVHKVTRLEGVREGLAIEFRAEFFNLFNHTNFADPDVNILSPMFGRITATSTGPREVQLAVKVVF